MKAIKNTRPTTTKFANEFSLKYQNKPAQLKYNNTITHFHKNWNTLFINYLRQHTLHNHICN